MDFFGGGPWDHPKKDHLCVGSRMEMFEYINIERQTYASHTAYDGYPWKGENSQMTWSTTFTWNDALGDEAQAEAEALAGGGSPKGTRFGYQNFAGEPMWLAGLETSKYIQSAESDPTVEQPQLYEAGKWHSSNNGTMRQGVFYQTGTGANRSKKLLGVGLAEVGNGCVWWVLIFGE
ncbi:MAG: hypothetical protein E3J72_22600 [Planctomycetota bacterium]|nr:MAG: hypothetical protein E3J72_22600 [Planctomycetota bacterium]